MKEFKELCKPIVEYLKEKHHPYCKIIITDSNAILFEDKMAMQFK